MKKGLEQQSLAVKSGVYPLYRYNPLLIEQGKNPLVLDYKQPSIPIKDYAYNETRYRMLVQSNENRAETLMKLAQKDAEDRWTRYSQMASVPSKPVEPAKQGKKIMPCGWSLYSQGFNIWR